MGGAVAVGVEQFEAVEDDAPGTVPVDAERDSEEIGGGSLPDVGVVGKTDGACQGTLPLRPRGVLIEHKK